MASVRRHFKKALPYLGSLLAVYAIYRLHMTSNVDSMLNENNTRISHVFLQSQIDYHQELPPFARRPLTSHLMEAVAPFVGGKAGHGFIAVNFLFLFLSGILLYRLSRILGADPNGGLVNLVLYFGSFSVLFAFFPPVFTFDEPLQYCLLWLSLIAFVKRRMWMFTGWFTLALIARETSVLLLPGLFLFAPGREDGPTHKAPRWRQGLVLLFPVLLYGLYLLLFFWKSDHWEGTQMEMGSRFGCFLENFENGRNTMESVLSLLVTLGPFVYCILLWLNRKSKPDWRNPWVHAFLLTALLNTPLVYLTAFARESRLFALPLLLLWPVMSQLVKSEIRLLVKGDAYRQLFQRRKLMGALIVSTLILVLFCYGIYAPSGLADNTYYTEYLCIMGLGILLHFGLWRASRPKR